MTDPDIPTLATSAPKYEEEEVLDVIYGFESGAVKDFTLHTQQGDTFDRLGDRDRLTLHDNGVYPEVIEVKHTSVAWISSRKRLIRKRIDLAPAPESPAPAAPAAPAGPSGSPTSE